MKKTSPLGLIPVLLIQMVLILMQWRQQQYLIAFCIGYAWCCILTVYIPQTYRHTRICLQVLMAVTGCGLTYLIFAQDHPASMADWCGVVMVWIGILYMVLLSRVETRRNRKKADSKTNEDKVVVNR
ncbi:hypothetical protein [Allobaculum sp. JKK-2023]|uniref:hypothetical protein n=1 Tax=Allobaculum sp. JKK-2023 TaxID=3108943 RepID=UPI002B05C663|nr:hypothetical protein [Allobaculum sp. JKK-2023]